MRRLVKFLSVSAERAVRASMNQCLFFLTNTDLSSDRREIADMRVRSNDTQHGSQPARQPNEPVEKLKRDPAESPRCRAFEASSQPQQPRAFDTHTAHSLLLLCELGRYDFC
ncbi:hypothetical protein SRHO_G00191330 [Serrasalmus rhombeus]